MTGTEIVKLAAAFAVGGITADAIRERYGQDVLTSVLALAGGVAVGAVTDKVLDVVDDHTGLVSDLGSVVDDVVDTFKFW